MKLGRFDPRKPYFQGVAIATLLCGVLILALGVVELALNLWAHDLYSDTVFKVVGGLVVISLSYIHLELEMLRIK